MTNRRGMVRWYNPVQLLRTGIDIFVSEELNARADPRLLEVQSGADPDFAEGSDPIGEDGFWFDYMADTADGYAPTFAMARLLSRESFGFHANEAFSALRIQSHKNFLRFRIAPDGSLTIYALGLDRLGGEPRIVDELVLNGTEL